MPVSHPAANGPTSAALRSILDRAAAGIERLRPAVDTHVSRERVLRYLTALADRPAPSTAASAMRGPVLRSLWQADGVLDPARTRLDFDFLGTGSTVLLTGGKQVEKPLWLFAHLDTISYLVQPRSGAHHPLVPFCYHLVEEGRRLARAYRFDVSAGRYVGCAEGELATVDRSPVFIPRDAGVILEPGDRVVPVARPRLEPDGTFVGQLDNAGAVAALAVAAPLLASSGLDSMLAFPDEEEGPHGSGSQVMGRGTARIVNQLPPPDLALVADMQQGRLGAPGGTILGEGAVLAEFSSLARGAVTPPHLYATASQWARLLAPAGVRIQSADNSYTSRSDDVSVLLRTPNIVLLGFPGLDRHFDRAEPSARFDDIVDLAKALAYAPILQSMLRELRAHWEEAPWTSSPSAG